MILTNGYATGYSADRVRQRAEFAAKAITDMLDYTGATSVVVHGNSGVSCGFAALMVAAAPFNLVLLRKDNDNSHGAPIEGPEGHRLEGYLILDDFVGTGDTLNRVRDKIAHLRRQRLEQADAKAECLGVVLYNYHHGDKFTFSDGRAVPVLHGDGDDEGDFLRCGPAVPVLHGS